MSSSLYERWDDWPSDLKAPIVAQLGPLKHASIFDVPEQDDPLTGRPGSLGYAIQDATSTRLLGPTLLDRVKSQGLERVLAIDMGAMPMCAYMHRKGMLIDPKRFEVLSAKLAVLMGEELATCRELLSEPDFNPDSSDQLAEVFFDKLQLHRLVGYKPKRTPSQERYAADNAALQAVKSAHPAVFHTLRFREYSKLKGAFADKLPLMADANGRIHTAYLARELSPTAMLRRIRTFSKYLRTYPATALI